MLTFSSTEMKAVLPSSLSCLRWRSGSGALYTSGIFRIAVTDCWIAVALAPSVTAPVATWKTIGLAPFCCGGNSSASRSVASWLPVPGRLRSLFVCSADPRDQHADPRCRHDPHGENQEPVARGETAEAIEELSHRGRAPSAQTATVAEERA